MHPSGRIFYKEEQSMQNSPVIWILYVSAFFITVFLAFGLFQQEMQNKPIGNQPVSDTHLKVVFGIFFFLMVGGIFYVIKMKLVTIIDNQGIKLEFFPRWIKKITIKKETIISYEIRHYKPFVEYGGWGLQSGGKKNILGRKYWGVAYNVKGTIGLQLYLIFGSKVLIGTQNPSGIKRAMKKLMKEEGGM